MKKATSSGVIVANLGLRGISCVALRPIARDGVNNAEPFTFMQLFLWLEHKRGAFFGTTKGALVESILWKILRLIAEIIPNLG